MSTLKGVLPLVCACCGEAVGVINATAFEAMAVANEVYICRACMQADAERVEASLALSYPGEWEMMTYLEMQGVGDVAAN